LKYDLHFPQYNCDHIYIFSLLFKDDPLTASQNSVLCEHSQLIIIIVAQAILRWMQVKYETILLSFCVHNGFLVKWPCRIQIKRPLLMHSNYLSREQYQCFDFSYNNEEKNYHVKIWQQCQPKSYKSKFKYLWNSN
jgi:hypothetical protein